MNEGKDKKQKMKEARKRGRREEGMERWKKRRKENRRGGKECGIILTRNILSSIDSKMNIQQSYKGRFCFAAI